MRYVVLFTVSRDPRQMRLVFDAAGAESRYIEVCSKDRVGGDSWQPAGNSTPIATEAILVKAIAQVTNMNAPSVEVVNGVMTIVLGNLKP